MKISNIYAGNFTSVAAHQHNQRTLQVMDNVLNSCRELRTHGGQLEIDEKRVGKFEGEHWRT